uniref:Prostaglandin E receptor 2b (subtype EP2) n=1 Tax=Callorhinchus milii TaxID=7868 RepID=A0A4W3I5Z1_CALMI
GLSNGKISSVSAAESPLTSALMFTAGVTGNLVALVILGLHKKDNRSHVSLFHILVTGLLVTDLAGTLLISPVVLTAYARGRSLKALDLCQYCAFAMAFFGLASMLILFAMAVERCLSLSHPYFYQRHTSKRCGIVAVSAAYAFCVLFCLLPQWGFGENTQYCPGTWCFIRLSSPARAHLAYSVLYAALMLVLIVSILICNLSVFVNLCLMCRRQSARRGSTLPGTRRRDRFPHSEEANHLVLLVIMTVIFVVCSVPLTVRAFIGAIVPDNEHMRDLTALRCLSFNSIIDPWIFIILNTSVVKKGLARILCCKISSRKQEMQIATSNIRTETIKQDVIWDRQS